MKARETQGLRPAEVLYQIQIQEPVKGVKLVPAGREVISGPGSRDDLFRSFGPPPAAKQVGRSDKVVALFAEPAQEIVGSVHVPEQGTDVVTVLHGITFLVWAAPEWAASEDPCSVEYSRCARGRRNLCQVKSVFVMGRDRQGLPAGRKPSLKTGGKVVQPRGMPAERRIQIVTGVAVGGNRCRVLLGIQEPVDEIVDPEAKPVDIAGMVHGDPAQFACRMRIRLRRYVPEQPVEGGSVLVQVRQHAFQHGRQVRRASIGFAIGTQCSLGHFVTS
ncbi:MAG: hypothetical protein ACP5EN_13435 [Rhodovulum sp.]